MFKRNSNIEDDNDMDDNDNEVRTLKKASTDYGLK
jgi:hypothetical protein